MACTCIVMYLKILLMSVVLLVLLLSANTRGQKNNNAKIPPGSPKGHDYCRESCHNPQVNPKHVFCHCDHPKYANRIWEPRSSENMTALREFTLHWHNHFRNRMALGQETEIKNKHNIQMPTASNMIAFTWDYVMEDSARCNAKRSIDPLEHDGCHMTPVRPLFSGGGQNLYVVGPKVDCLFSKYANGIMPGCDSNKFNKYEVLAYTALYSWYSELADFFNLSVIDVYHPSIRAKSLGHMTQMLWAETEGVGCGSSKHKKKFFFTCHYYPNGNAVGANFYKRGKPASNCPKKHPANQDERYKGLCGRAEVPTKPPRSFFISYEGSRSGNDPRPANEDADSSEPFSRAFPLSLFLFVTFLANTFFN